MLRFVQLGAVSHLRSAMKSLITVRRIRPLVTGLLSASVIVGFIACSGSSERRAGRNTGEGGEYEAAGGAGPQSGGSTARGGEPASGGMSQAGEPNLAGSGGSSAGDTGGGGDVGVGGAVDAGGAAAGGESSGGAAVGGESSGGAAVGGESSGGAGAGGESSGGSGGEGGNGDVIDPVCGLNMVQVGAYSLWCGKVNMHQTAPGVWTHDTDCSSGCNVNGVGYCQKYYPSTTKVVTVPQTETKDWKNAGCADSAPDGPGISGEAACCAPLP
jgi:hypothetical protein